MAIFSDNAMVVVFDNAIDFYPDPVPDPDPVPVSVPVQDRDYIVSLKFGAS